MALCICPHNCAGVRHKGPFAVLKMGQKGFTVSGPCVMIAIKRGNMVKRKIDKDTVKGILVRLVGVLLLGAMVVGVLMRMG